MHKPLKPILLLLSSALLFTACASLEPLRSDIQRNSLSDGYADYLSQPDFSEQFTHVTALEARIIALSSDEPLAMGALGSALVEIQPSSLTGHYALTRFYQHVDASQAANRHEQLFQQLQNQILASGDGSAARPYQVLSKADAELLIRGQARSLVGGIYQNSETMPLQLLLLSRSTNASPVTADYFDLSKLIPAISEQGIGPPQQATHGTFYESWRTKKTLQLARPLAPISPSSVAMSPRLAGCNWRVERTTC